jgi:hypothetical protein
MRLEHIPLILGVIVALIGLGFIADASMAAATPVTPERRRRTRAEPSRAGEAVVGIGTLCMAAALFGRDTWRYGTVAVLFGSGLLLVGIILNRAFLKEALLFRGPARRSEEGVAGKTRAPQGGGRDRAAGTAPAPTPVRPAVPKAGPMARPPVRHPTPPVGSRAYTAPEPASASPTPVAGQARFDAAPPAPTPGKPVGARPSDAPPPATPTPVRPPAAPPPKKAQEPPGTPPERRKTPRGKR